MYNHQLDTFLIVTDEKSFAGAGKRMYISPSAVYQQIISLEKNLGVRLFDRSNRGLKLTEAGEYLLSEVREIKALDERIRQKMPQFGKTDHVLKIGVPKMHKSRCFYELWTLYSAEHPEKRIEFVEAPTSNTEDTFKFYASLDLIEFVAVPSKWQKEKHFLKLGTCSMSLGVPKNHRLAGREQLLYSDLKDETIVVSSFSVFEDTEDVKRSLFAAGAKVELVDTYNSSLLDQCAINGKLIAIPECSSGIHPMIVIKKVDWDGNADYGFFYSDECERGEDSFISFVKEKMEKGEYWFSGFGNG